MKIFLHLALIFHPETVTTDNLEVQVFGTISQVILQCGEKILPLHPQVVLDQVQEIPELLGMYTWKLVVVTELIT